MEWDKVSDLKSSVVDVFFARQGFYRAKRFFPTGGRNCFAEGYICGVEKSVLLKL